MDNKRGIIKSIVRIVNNAGCSKIVSNIITTTMVPGNIISTICIKCAGFCLGSALGDFANDYTSRKIDEYADAYEKGKLVQAILGLEIEDEEEQEEFVEVNPDEIPEKFAE